MTAALLQQIVRRMSVTGTSLRACARPIAAADQMADAVIASRTDFVKPATHLRVGGSIRSTSTRARVTGATNWFITTCSGYQMAPTISWGTARSVARICLLMTSSGERPCSAGGDEKLTQVGRRCFAALLQQIVSCYGYDRRRANM